MKEAAIVIIDSAAMLLGVSHAHELYPVNTEPDGAPNAGTEYTSEESTPAGTASGEEEILPAVSILEAGRLTEARGHRSEDTTVGGLKETPTTREILSKTGVILVYNISELQ